VLVIQESEVDARAEEVWARAVTPEGINAELRPWMRMRVPRALRGKTIDEVPLGEPIGRSWILLLGFLPFDYDDLCLVERGPGLRFLERSKMLSMTLWQHERTVVPAGRGCRVTDRLTFELRALLRALPGAERRVERLIAAIFAHRHRRLAAAFADAG
jgi:ligand-binding SRPBCC domain-containing protein